MFIFMFITVVMSYVLSLGKMGGMGWKPELIFGFKEQFDNYRTVEFQVKF